MMLPTECGWDFKNEGLQRLPDVYSTQMHLHTSEGVIPKIDGPVSQHIFGTGSAPADDDEDKDEENGTEDGDENHHRQEEGDDGGNASEVLLQEIRCGSQNS